MSPTSESTNDTKNGRAAKDKKEAQAVKAITINVMGREFRVAAVDGEERQLVASVDLLNKKMKEIRDSGKVVGNERIAIMAALNIAHDHLHESNVAVTKVSEKNLAKNVENSHQLSVDEAYAKRKMQDMENMIERAITDQEKLF